MSVCLYTMAYIMYWHCRGNVVEIVQRQWRRQDLVRGAKNYEKMIK